MSCRKVLRASAQSVIFHDLYTDDTTKPRTGGLWRMLGSFLISPAAAMILAKKSFLLATYVSWTMLFKYPPPPPAQEGQSRPRRPDHRPFSPNPLVWKNCVQIVTYLLQIISWGSVMLNTCFDECLETRSPESPEECPAEMSNRCFRAGSWKKI